jgi:4-carboxymuconolactone decarboxylase
VSGGDLDRAEVGKELRERAQGAMAPRLQNALGSLDPELADIADEFIFGRVWTGEGIAFEERMLVAITALAAGDHQEQLRNYLHGALQAGVPAEKLHEALKMLVVYCGFPTTLHALGTFAKVRAAHEKRQG